MGDVVSYNCTNTFDQNTLNYEKDNIGTHFLVNIQNKHYLYIYKAVLICLKKDRGKIASCYDFF